MILFTGNSIYSYNISDIIDIGRMYKIRAHISTVYTRCVSHARNVKPAHLSAHLPAHLHAHRHKRTHTIRIRIRYTAERTSTIPAPDLGSRMLIAEYRLLEIIRFRTLLNSRRVIRR